MTDLISRQAVLDIIRFEDKWLLDAKGHNTDTEIAFSGMKSKVSDLPPITPQPETVLYSGDGYADGYMVYDMAECPNCGYGYEEGDKDWGLPFCPNCGQSLNWESEGEE